MQKEKELFRVAEALAAIFTGMQTEADERVIEEWASEHERNRVLVGQIMDKTRFEENRALLAQFPAGEAWKRVRGRVTGRTARWRRVARYAAAVLLLAGLPPLYYLSREPELPVQEVARLETPYFTSGTTGALLTLGNGQVVNIDKQTVLSVTEQDGTTIVVDSGGMNYRPDEAAPVVASAETVYNVVRTPTGMEFPVTLSDGTQVYLNAESCLRFPATFAGDTREVELEGEAFFKVTPDAARPFVVRAIKVEIKVLGTSFNLRAYKNERAVAATLVEGRVALADADRQWELAPGKQARYFKATGECEIRDVDVDHYTAWQSGKFVFKNERLEEVLSYLSRWYGFEYEFYDERSRNVMIGASLNRYADMEPIIKILEESRLVRVMVSDDNRVVIYSK